MRYTRQRGYFGSLWWTGCAASMLLSGCTSVCEPGMEEAFSQDGFELAARCFRPVGSEAPDLPDTTGYTSDTVRSFLPTPSEGRALVVDVTEIPRVDRLTDQSSIATLQALQSTEHPRGIFVIDGDWTLEGLRAHLADETAIAREGGVYTVGLPIVVMGEATLSILGPEVSELRLLADYGALLSNHGSLFVVDTRLLGWSEGDGAPAFFVDKTVFRPFVLGSTGSRTFLVGSELSHLGYDSAKSYGVSFTSTGEALMRNIRAAGEPYTWEFDEARWPVGWMAENVMYDNFMALYTYEAMDLMIVRNTIIDSILYGLDPHDRSTRLIMSENWISGTAERHGLIISREVNHSYIMHNHCEGNQRAGIMLDRSSTHNVVAFNETFYNGTDGIALYESQHNVLYGNHSKGNASAGIRLRNSWDVDVHNNLVEEHEGYGFRGYTFDLTEDDDSYERDFDYDPFSLRMSARMDGNTFVDNAGGHISASDVEALYISDTTVRRGGPLFEGDLKHYGTFAEVMMEMGHGVQFLPVDE